VPPGEEKGGVFQKINRILGKVGKGKILRSDEQETRKGKERTSRFLVLPCGKKAKEGTRSRETDAPEREIAGERNEP